MNCEVKSVLRRSRLAGRSGGVKKLSCDVVGGDMKELSSAAVGEKQRSISKPPSNKPKRPRSAFQLFFHHEKDKIVAEAETNGSDALLSEIIANKGTLCGVGGDGSGGSSSGPDSDREQDAAASAAAVQRQELARAVSRRWKALDASSRAIYDGLALLEKKKYERRVASWERTREAELERQQDKDKDKAVVGAKKRPLSTTEGGGGENSDLEPLKKKRKNGRASSSSSSNKRSRGGRKKDPKKSKKPKPALGLFAVPRHIRSRRFLQQPLRSPPPAPSFSESNVTSRRDGDGAGAVRVAAAAAAAPAPSAPPPPPLAALTVSAPSSDAASVSSLSCCSSASASGGGTGPKPVVVERPLSPLSRAAAAVADESLPNDAALPPCEPIAEESPPPPPPPRKRGEEGGLLSSGLYDPFPPVRRRQGPLVHKPLEPLGSGLLGPVGPPPLPASSSNTGLGFPGLPHARSSCGNRTTRGSSPPLGSGLLGPIESPPLPSSSAEPLGFPGLMMPPAPTLLGPGPGPSKKEKEEDNERMRADLYSPTPICDEQSAMFSDKTEEVSSSPSSSSSLDKESVGFLTSIFFAPVVLMG